MIMKALGVFMCTCVWEETSGGGGGGGGEIQSPIRYKSTRCNCRSVTEKKKKRREYGRNTQRCAVRVLGVCCYEFSVYFFFLFFFFSLEIGKAKLKEKKKTGKGGKKSREI